ncbi:MAG TPA: LemA family protein [Pyrinomonadaceae bacterium]|jgi:LemA protein
MTKEKAYRRISSLVIFLLLLTCITSQAPANENIQLTPVWNKTSYQQDEKAAEQNLWHSIKNSSDPQSYKSFLAKYPHGKFAYKARGKLAALLGEDYATLYIKWINLNREWANVEKQVQRRADIIPSLVRSLLATGIDEAELFGQIAEARARLLNELNAAPNGEGGNKTPEQKLAIIEADNNFSNILKKFDSLEENYPRLRSLELFLNQQAEKHGIENRLNVYRIDYNNVVQIYSSFRSKSKGLPEGHKFPEEPYFKSTQGKPKPPGIDFVPFKRKSVD